MPSSYGRCWFYAVYTWRRYRLMLQYLSAWSTWLTKPLIRKCYDLNTSIDMKLVVMDGRILLPNRMHRIVLLPCENCYLYLASCVDVKIAIKLWISRDKHGIADEWSLYTSCHIYCVALENFSSEHILRSFLLFRALLNLIFFVIESRWKSYKNNTFRILGNRYTKSHKFVHLVGQIFECR